MPGAKLSFPEQWEDWCNWLLGIWLCISPWALRFDFDPTATKVAVVTGIVIILSELLALSFFRTWEELIDIILGAWLIISPWTLDISSPTVKLNFVLVGLLVLSLAVYEIWDERRQSE